MFCPKCGTELKEDAVFCKKCGARIKAAGNQQPPAASANEAGRQKTGETGKPEKNGMKKRKLPLLLAGLAGAALLAVSCFLFNEYKNRDKAPAEGPEWGNHQEIPEKEEERQDETSEEVTEDGAEDRTETERETSGETVAEPAAGDASAGAESETEEESQRAGQTAWPQDSGSARADGAGFYETEEGPYITMEHVSSVTASSELREGSTVHSASGLMDGSLSKAWVEGASGQGIGEGVSFVFDGEYMVGGFIINAGYQKSSDLYYKNSRPASLRVMFDDGSSQVYQLEDINGAQDICFDSPRMTGSISFYIESVYGGSKYEDTVISEMRLY